MVQKNTYQTTLKISPGGSSHYGLAIANPTSIPEDAGSISGIAQWIKELWLGHRCGSDLALLWLWHRPLASIAPIRPLTWEPPYATRTTLKRPKKKKITRKFNFYMWIFIREYKYCFLPSWIYHINFQQTKNNDRIVSLYKLGNF